MNKTNGEYVFPHWLRSWEQFWFTPRDPSLLGLIRITCGLIATYTFMAYGFHLQNFMGEHAWHDLHLRNDARYERPVSTGPLEWNHAGRLPRPANAWQQEYLDLYQKIHGEEPPPPYPEVGDQEMVTYLHEFRVRHGIDLRVNGAPLPSKTDNNFQKAYAEEYTLKWHGPPPAYAKDHQEALEIALYMERFGADPRRLYAKGTPVFSIWFHVLDPDDMAIVQGAIVLIAALFTIGFCTRCTTALTWFASLCYIHRNPSVLFGVDTMMTIVLLYLMIGPAGATFSVDNLIRRWWRTAKPGMVQRWYAFWKLPAPSLGEIAPAAVDSAAPSVAANVAIRLLQVHVCIIYLFAGLSKLQGQAWWTGNAIWLTLGNYEFTPMQFELYRKFLRFLGEHQWLYDGFMTGGGLFTLVFEISFAFLIWRPRLRWVFLAGVIILHGLIGLFLGLKTFSLMMLVMNMAFLRTEEALWFFQWHRAKPSSAAASSTPAPEPAKAPVQAAAQPVT